MAFVGEPFKHDIFVSYSHGDVLGDGRALLKQWSQGFVRELELELQAFPDLGSQIKVFLDQHFRPGQGIDPLAPLTDNLKSEVAASAMLAALVSPQYLDSQWCGQEREWWIQAQSTLGIQHHRRIAVARIWPTGETRWPAELADADGHQHVGHIFYDKSKADIRPQPFSWPSIDSQTGPFRDALLDFVGSIRMRLLELKRDLDQRRKREEERERLAAPTGQVIYLHGRNAHATIWQRVHRELEGSGYTIFPVQPEQLESDPRRIRDIQNERIATMSGCDAILLLGTDDVPALTADLMVVGRLDRHQAVARSNRSLPCGIVDTAGVVRQNADWPRKARRLGVDWFDASVQPWTPQVGLWLNGAAV